MQRGARGSNPLPPTAVDCEMPWLMCTSTRKGKLFGAANAETTAALKQLSMALSLGHTRCVSGIYPEASSSFIEVTRVEAWPFYPFPVLRGTECLELTVQD